MNALCERTITGCTPAHSGYGFVTALITAGTTLTSMIFQERMSSRQHRQARHERARVQQREADERARQAAAAAELVKMQQAQTQIATNATGGAVAVNAHGQPLPASGVASGFIPAGMSPTVLLVGAGVIGLGLIFIMGRK